MMDFYVPIGFAYEKHNEWADIDAEIHKRHKESLVTGATQDQREDNNYFFRAS